MQRCDGKSYLEDEKNTIIEGDCAVDIKLARSKSVLSYDKVYCIVVLGDIVFAFA